MQVAPLILLLCAPRESGGQRHGPLAATWAAHGSRYEISVDGTAWLRSAPVRIFASGQWFSAAPSSVHEQQLQYRSQRSWTGHDALGAFSATSVEWGAGDVPLLTQTRMYQNDSAGAARLVFEQELPLGAIGTQSERSCANNLEQCDPKHPPPVRPVVSFPSFAVGGSEPSERMSWLTWYGTQIDHAAGTGLSTIGDKGYKNAHEMFGLTAGPIALFDASSSEEGWCSVVSAWPDRHVRLATSHRANNSIGFGVSSELPSLPVGFVHRTLFVVAKGLTQTMGSWGATAQRAAAMSAAEHSRKQGRQLSCRLCRTLRGSARHWRQWIRR